MACALTQNYTLDCKDSIGGLKEVYFAAVEDTDRTQRCAVDGLLDIARVHLQNRVAEIDVRAVVAGDHTRPISLIRGIAGHVADVLETKRRIGVSHCEAPEFLRKSPRGNPCPEATQ